MQHILINLNIISKIKPNDKIYMNSDNYMSIEQDSAFQGIFRFIFNNSRTKNLNNLNYFYTSVYNCIDDTINSKYLLLCNDNHNCDIENENFVNIYNNLIELNHYLKLSLIGLENLKKTYISDVVTISKLDIIINDAETYIKKIQKKIDYINDLKKNIV
jgi:hypothetical protein